MENKKHIEDLAISAFPDNRLTELGLQASEIANLRSGFITGFNRAESNQSDLMDCFRSFIRSKHHSADWDEWITDWNKPLFVPIPKETWDERFNAQADANLSKKCTVDWSEEMKIKDKILQKANLKEIDEKIDDILDDIESGVSNTKRKLIEMILQLK